MLFLIIYISAILLSAALPLAIAYIIRMKKDVRNIKGSLQKLKGADINMRLTTSLYRKDVAVLAQEMNEVFDYKQSVQMESERVNHEIRQEMTNIFHDLRTPLTSVIGYIGLIKSDEIDDAKKHEYLDVVEGRLTSLANLMSELFDHMQMIEGKVEFELESVDLCHLVREEIAFFHDAFIQRNFEIAVDIPEQPLPLVTAPAQLRQIVQNLLSNVLKHGVDQFLVKISSDGVMTFTNKVADVESLEVSHLFERFYTSDATGQSQKKELGLAITKVLVEKMNGKISAALAGDMLSIVVDLSKKN